MMTRMKYLKLARGNDWGHEFVMYATKRLCAGNKANALNLMDGKRVRVRFPDKSTAVETICMRHFSTTVGDMGHVYPVSYDFPGINVCVHGIKVWVPLDEFELEAGFTLVGKT